MAEKKKLHKSKTFWTGIVGLISTSGAYFSGEMETATAIQTAVTCFIGIFLRSGMLKD